MNKKILVAVYGSLRQGLHNHKLLESSNYLGDFNTEPIYSLYSLGSFPGLKENGNTSVVMEVYEVTEAVARNVDSLESYTPGGNNTFYDKISIETPWGTASVYTYVNELPQSSLVESGDWKEFKENALSFYSIRNN